MVLSLPVSPPRRRLSSWTAPGRRETIFVFCLFTVALFIFQSNLSVSYSDDDDSSAASSWSWRSNSDWFSSGSASHRVDNPKKLKSTGENVMPSIQGSENSGLTVNDVTVSWNGPKEKMPQTALVQHTEGEFGVACFAWPLSASHSSPIAPLIYFYVSIVLLVPVPDRYAPFFSLSIHSSWQVLPYWTISIRTTGRYTSSQILRSHSLLFGP